jgi:hypothetical protein
VHGTAPERRLLLQLLTSLIRQGQQAAFHAGQPIVAVNTRNQTLWVVLSGRCAVVCTVKATGLVCPKTLALLSRTAHTRSLEEDHARVYKRAPAHFECELRRLEAGDVFDEISSWREHRGLDGTLELGLVARSDVELLKISEPELHKRHPAIYTEMFLDSAERSRYYADRRTKIMQTIVPDVSELPPPPPPCPTVPRQPIHTARVTSRARCFRCTSSTTPMLARTPPGLSRASQRGRACVAAAWPCSGSRRGLWHRRALA